MRHNKQGGLAKAGSRGPPPALSLAECICPICQELLAEPVTPPCGHSLCRGCFQQTVEISNLNCPLCRRRLSNWVRAQARCGGLVNTELEQRIRQQFPRDGVLEPAEVDRFCPPPQLCKPGELRQEYEEQISKLKEERRAREEEEHKASEDFIQKLLAEEQQMYVEQKKKEMDEQLKRDEQLAKMLSEEVNWIHRTSSESLGGCSKSISSKLNSSITKGTKLTARSPNNMENIERYLSPTLPKYQTAEMSRLRSNFSGPESTCEADESISSSSSIASNHLFLCDKEEEPVSSSNQSESIHFIEGTPNETITDGQIECTSENSPEHNENKVLRACSSTENGGEKSMEDVPLKELKMNSVNCNDDLLDSTFVPVFNHELEHACTSAGCCSSDNIDYATVQNLTEGEVAEHEILSQSPCKTTVMKRKACSSSDDSTPTCVKVKKRRICPNVHNKPSENSESFHEVFHHEHLADWEKQLFEKHKMEEQDRLLALKIQKELDKEMRIVNRTRGTPDEYLLRTKKLPTSCDKKVLAKNKTPLATLKGHQTSRSSARSQSSTSECGNKQAMLKNISSKTCRQRSRILQDPTGHHGNQRARCQRPLASMDANSAALMPISELRNGKKQQTIDDMFQKHNAK
ncbi:E3 ubiquitin-protein ligase rnf168 [Pristis pectinata]|uniref:E3 ubiquitin-protein ligase rnf168 n=1 Tax=Pristis pectinata TaxID=685728 RepID=UPI00223CFBF4|nr:E3 ubiquitin-protein ligase rnf168 [Pristis pectinata]